MSWGFNDNKKSSHFTPVWSNSNKRNDAWTQSMEAKALAKKKEIKEKRKAKAKKDRELANAEFEERINNANNSNGNGANSTPPALSRPGCFSNSNFQSRVDSQNNKSPAKMSNLQRPSFLPK